MGDGRLITVCWVPGQPRTKGSMTSAGRRGGQMRESVDNKAWRALVTRTVEDDLMFRHGDHIQPLREPPSTPVRVDLTFWLDHPDVCEPKPGAGDVDKLVRLVLDALKDAGAYVDDNQVQRVTALKLPSGGLQGDSGVLIAVQETSSAEIEQHICAAEWERAAARRPAR